MMFSISAAIVFLAFPQRAGQGHGHIDQQAIGSILGPTLGGLSQTFWAGAISFINVPIGIVQLLLPPGI